MPYKIQIVSIIASAMFMYFIFRLVLKGKLREEYSVVWIICTLVLIFLSVFRSLLDTVAKLLGVYYAPSLLFLLGFLAVVTFLVHLSLVNSKQQSQIKDLAHEIAFLKKKLEEKNG